MCRIYVIKLVSYIHVYTCMGPSVNHYHRNFIKTVSHRFQWPCDGERLSGPCLAIGEGCAVVAFEGHVDELLHATLLQDILLGSFPIKDMVEGELFVLICFHLQRYHRKVQLNLSTATTQEKHIKWSPYTGFFRTCFNEKPFSRETKNVGLVDCTTTCILWLFIFKNDTLATRQDRHQTD